MKTTWLESGAADAAVLAEGAERRLAERVAEGRATAAAIERAVALPLRTFAGDESASEAFRRCCIAHAVARPVAITSHRPFVGPLLVGAKRLLRRLLRFQTETFLVRQEEFNRNLLVVLRELFERMEHERAPRPPDR